MFPRGESDGPKTSEWPQFSGLPRQGDLGGYRLDRSRSLNRHVTMGAIGSDVGNTLSGSTTPLVSQSPDLSRRPSPPSGSTFSDAPSLNTHITSTASSARSVPATPLTAMSNSGLRAELGMPSAKTGVPISPGIHSERTNGSQQDYSRGFAGEHVNGYARPYDSLTFGSIRADEATPAVRRRIFAFRLMLIFADPLRPSSLEATHCTIRTTRWTFNANPAPPTVKLIMLALVSETMR